MDFGTVVWAIIIVVVVVSRVLKGARSEDEKRKVARDQEGFEAAPEEIQEFLRSLSTAAQRKAEGVRAQPEAAVQPRPAQAALPRPTDTAFWEAKPTRQPTPVVAVPTPRPKRSKPRRKSQPTARRKSPPPEVLAAREPVAVPKPTSSRGAPILALRGTDLRRAIVWSEVLGPPMSLRRNRRLPLGPQ